MKIKDILQQVELPQVYKREGKDCYFDTYRKKLIEITPEETVRQRVAALFEKEYGVPREMMLLEVPMSYYVQGIAGRADIIIHSFDEEEQVMLPIAIIECKNEDVFLTDKVAEQAIRYCDAVGGLYIIITNGVDLRMAAYDEEKDYYVYLDKVLSYEEMISKRFSMPEILEQKISRFSIEELENQELLQEFNDAGTWIFGADSDPKVRTLAVNLYQALLDTEHKLPSTKRKNFELIEDIGQRFLDYGNAGGGHYNGIYRAFLVKDRFDENQIVSMSLFGTDANFRGENRTSYTSLTVAIDRFKVSHNSLQYNMDRFIKFKDDDAVTFLHNGQISSIKSETVKQKVSLNGAGVTLRYEDIVLGTIDMDKILYLDEKDVSEFIYNLIEYALLREEVRRDKRTE